MEFIDFLVPLPSLPMWLYGGLIALGVVPLPWWIGLTLIASGFPVTIAMLVVIRRHKGHCRAVFLRMQSGIYYMIGQKRFRLDAQVVRFKGSTFPIDLTRTAYLNNANPRIYYDYDTMQLLSFKASEEGMLPKLLDKLVHGHIMLDLSSRLGMTKTNIALMFLFLILGAFATYTALSVMGYVHVPTNATIPTGVEPGPVIVP